MKQVQVGGLLGDLEKRIREVYGAESQAKIKYIVVEVLEPVSKRTLVLKPSKERKVDYVKRTSETPG